MATILFRKGDSYKMRVNSIYTQLIGHQINKSSNQIFRHPDAPIVVGTRYKRKMRQIEPRGRAYARLYALCEIY